MTLFALPRADHTSRDQAPTTRRAVSNREARSIRVLLVDDHRALADALSRLLAGEPGISVVGTAYTAAGARATLRDPVDIVLMDYALPDGTGAELTRAVKARWPKGQVIMLTAHDDDETVLESIQAGADGFLAKTASIEEILAAIRSAHAGETLLPPSVIAKIAHRVRVAREQVSEAMNVEPLTSRELEILRELSAGRTTREICQDLSIAPNTLRTHVQNITAKLHVHSKLEAVVFALRYGLVEPPSPAEDRLYP
jgi:two-component system NarL family response regulator